jgi:hypothetical protein
LSSATARGVDSPEELVQLVLISDGPENDPMEIKRNIL